MLHTIYFSPSGTTKKTARLIAGNIDADFIEHDITLGDVPVLNDDDPVLIAVPVYAGRVPELASARLSRLCGNGRKAVAAVIYGNRDYDDALLELCEILFARGFDVVTAGAFIAQHCIFPKVAADRPDEYDEQKIKKFAEYTVKAFSSGSSLDIGTVKGKKPYKKPGAVPLHPEADKKVCNECGKCATQCPVEAIDHEHPYFTDKTKCISCCRCINICPQGARSFRGLLYKVAGWKFVRDNTRRLEPEWFV